MPTSAEYLAYVKEQLSEIDNISYKKMMGEYLVYYKGKYIAAVCDNRLLIKPFEGVELYLPSINYQKPYDGARDMLLVEFENDTEGFYKLFETAYRNIPEAKLRGRKDKKERA